jgi:hypothetical protein
MLLETMEQNCHITDLDLEGTYTIGNEGASLLARSLGNNALRDLTRLSLLYYGIKDDAFIALVTAPEQNTSLLQLDLRQDSGVSERTSLALAESLPEIQALQRVDLRWCEGLVPTMPSLLAGLHKNTSLFRFHVANCVTYMVRAAGGWTQKMERLGYRNCFLPLLRAPKERLPPLGVWPRALARVAALPVPSEDAEGKEAAEDTSVPKKRKRGEQYGDCEVPQRYAEDRRLGTWVGKQRKERE